MNSIQKAVERRAVLEELAEKQAMLEGIIELNPYSIMITDRASRPIQTNRAHTKLMAMSPGQDGKIIFDEDLLIPEEAKEAIQREWAEKRKTYSVFTDDTALGEEESAKMAKQWQNGETAKCPPFRYLHPFPLAGSSMKPVWVGSTGFSIKNSDGQIINYISMHEDITARVEAEEALKKAHEDLTKAHEELRKAYEIVKDKVAERTTELVVANTKLQAEIDERVRLQKQLERQNSELEGFSHTLSHDLRNNLIVMQRLMERDTIAPDDRRKTQELLLDNTAHLQQFVERLLLLAQAERTIADKRKVSLDEAARKAFSMIAAYHADAKISVTSPFPPVLCDPGAFEQIFSNLFNNALAYVQPETKGSVPFRHAAFESTSAKGLSGFTV